MRPIGGELEVNLEQYNIYMTDSGRSSLRLFIRSSNRDKKYLIPNFFCEVIEEVFKEEGIEYSFYNVNSDLSIDYNTINGREYDVLYVINYFGKNIDISLVDLSDKILIEDNVFFSDFENNNNVEKWYAFNSFRKLSNVADGSLVKTNMYIDCSLILKEEAKFVSLKYSAKEIKYNYIYKNSGKEKQYLELFQKSEDRLNQQKNIYSISNKSTYLISKNTAQEIRKKRYSLLYKQFENYALFDYVDYYSFFIMKINNRDDFRKKMMSRNIFLPIHWPKSTQNNKLYDEIISIPLFEEYSNTEFSYLASCIKEAL